MIKITPQNPKLLLTTEEKILEKLIKENHPFRKLNNIIDFEALITPYRNLYSDIGTEGIDIIKGFKALMIQFWEDFSDREMEKALEENVAIKWFCGFHLLEKVPDHTYYCKLRKRLGTKNIADIFNQINGMLRAKGLFGDMFKFIDASTIVSKTALWEERDKALKNGEEKLNNLNVEKYAKDKEARWGAKSKTKFWFGYKRNVCVDMRYGLIDKIAITSAEILDFEALKNICPENCMVFMDKLFDVKKSYLWLRANNCHSGIIMKNNNKEKDSQLDKWKSKIRMPFEGTFSKLNKRARYKGKVKVLAQCYMQSICYNLKKAIRFIKIPQIKEA